MALGTPVIGTAAAGQGATLAVAYPASVGANDQLLLVCVQRPVSVGGGTFTPPSGWTTILSLIDKGGYGATAGSDTGNMNLFIAAKDALAAGGESGTVTASVGGNGVSSCAMVRVPSGGGRVTFDAAGGEQTAGGSVSVACSSNPGIKAGDVLLWGMSIPTDVTTPSQFSAHSVTASGATIGSATELVEFDSTAGNDLGGFVAWASCTAGASSGVPTIAATAGGTTTNVRGPVGMVVIRENAGTVLDRFNKSDYLTTSGGDLTVTNILSNLNAASRIRATNSVDDHRYYETLIGSLNSSEQMVAVANSSAVMTGFNFGEGANITSYKSGGNVHVDGTYAATISAFAMGDIVGTEIHPTNGVRWTVNGGSPSAWFALPSGTEFYPVSMLRVLDTGQQTQTLNFGQADGSGFAYPVPSGALGVDQTASGATAGSAAITLGAITLASTGALAIAATSSITLGNIATASTGKLAIAGTSSIALGAITTTATGTFTTFGASSITLGAVTISAAGELAIAAAATVTLGAIAVGATAALALKGTSSITLAPITVGGTSKLAIAGAGSIALGSLTLSAAGTSSATGSAAITLGAVTATATAKLAIAGTLTATLGAITATAAGKLEIKGSLGATLGAVSLSAVGSSTPFTPIEGNATILLGAIGVGSSGALAITASAGITLGTILVGATGSDPTIVIITPARRIASADGQADRVGIADGQATRLASASGSSDIERTASASGTGSRE